MAFLAVNGATSPTIEVSFDYTNDPTSASTTWTDITPYVVSYSRQPVRTNEFDQPGPATATVVLRNDDNRFTPDNPAGPYFGGLKKYRRIRVRAQWAGVTYNRYWGYVVDWPQSWAEAGKDQSVALPLVDALDPLGLYDFAQHGGAPGNPWGSSQVSGAAVSTICADMPGVTCVADTGRSTVYPYGAPGAGVPGAGQFFALQMLQNIAASENGVVFADGAGTVRFHDRAHRVTASSAATIGDGGPNEIPYQDPQPQYGDVWSVVQITPIGGGAYQRATNAAATSSYFKRTLNFPPAGQYLVSDTTEALNAANYLCTRYSNPVTRINGVTLIGAANTAQWPTILSLDTSTKVTFKRRLPNGQTISLPEFIEGYADSVTVGQDWRVTVPLSPADIQSYWVLGTSALNTSTTLFY
jgi:hypothetical protein